MRQQLSSNRRSGMPITAALEGRRGDRSTPEERLAEHLGSVRKETVGGFSVGGRISKREYGRLLDRIQSGTRKPRRRGGRGRKPVAS